MASPSSRKAASASRRRANRSRSKPSRDRVRAHPIIPGTRYLTTRRCVERRLFLTPDSENAERINNFIGYCLGVCLDLYSIDLHAAVYESNHEHLNITDVLGEVGAFKTTLHAWIARGINALRGRSDRFWSADEPVYVRSGDPLYDDEGEEIERTQLDDLIYTLTNPVKDGLTRNGGRWPGFTTYGWHFGETRTFKKPDWFFDPKNPDLPDEVSITLKRPKDVLRDLSDEEFWELLMQKVRTREAEYCDERRKKNKRFMGESKIRKQHWNKIPRSYEERFNTTRRVRDANPKRRRKALERDRAWRVKYADARRGLLAGEIHVQFPYGTYWMRRFAGVNVANAPP